MNLTQVEIALLHAVAFEPLFLHDIIRPLVFPYLPLPLFSAEQLTEAFLELQAKDFIAAVDESVRRKGKDDPIPFVPLTKESIELQFHIGQEIHEAMTKRVGIDWSAIGRNARISYRLTQSGGRAWEKMASPEWDKFVDYSLHVIEDADAEPDGHARGHLVAATMETLENYINWTLRWGNNSSPSQYLESVTFGRAVRISSWKPLYWKTLDEGYQCSMETLGVHYQLPDEDEQTVSQAERDEMDEHDQYFTWYKTPSVIQELWDLSRKSSRSDQS